VQVSGRIVQQFRDRVQMMAATLARNAMTAMLLEASKMGWKRLGENLEEACRGLIEVDARAPVLP
jgi:hypothetical protein